jgi:pimeloyl-ACP methyl ester carboxylesterase
MALEVTHRTVVANGLNMHVAEAGEGPLVLLCHGFPEIWHSWRHQLGALAAAGWHAVAPDMRGYGRTDAPEEIASYSILHLVGDVVGLVTALGVERAVIVGHDFGASLAWTAAQIRPDMFRAVAALSVPMRPRGNTPPLSLLRAHGLANLYYFYFQEPGVAEAEFREDVYSSLRRGYYTLSGDVPAACDWSPLLSPGSGFLDRMINPNRLPAWLGEDHLALATAEFERTGFRGGLNWYRNIDLNWSLLAAFEGMKIRQPALFVAGTRDISIAGLGKAALDELPTTVPGLERIELIEGAGHWIQEERPAEVNAALIGFLERARNGRSA